MSEPHIISALHTKRAELAGEVVTARKRLDRLRDDLEAIDRTLRVFDPAQQPDKIRPVVRRKGAKMFRHGECSRAVLDMLRRASAPMTTDEIAESLVVDFRLDLDGSEIRHRLLPRLRVLLKAFLRRGVVVSEGKPARWAVKP
jgi:hypothetical protein